MTTDSMDAHDLEEDRQLLAGVRLYVLFRRASIAEAEAWLIEQRYLMDVLESVADGWAVSLASLDGMLHRTRELREAER